jgi:hypothetical protein
MENNESTNAIQLNIINNISKTMNAVSHRMIPGMCIIILCKRHKKL